MHSMLLMRFARHDDGGIVFKQPYDNFAPDDYREEVKLGAATWSDMGEPNVVTVSIKPGGKLA